MEYNFQFGKCFICNDDCGTNQSCSSCIRKLSIEEIYLSSKPINQDNSDLSCAYCSNISFFIEGSYELGIRYCIKHKSYALKDMKKWLIQNNYVLLKDIREKYSDLYKILCKGIPLKRSSGKIDYNWKLEKTQNFIVKNNEFGWVIIFSKFENNSSFFTKKIVKQIPINFLLNDLEYNIYFKSMIKKLKDKLEFGFYID